MPYQHNHKKTDELLTAIRAGDTNLVSNLLTLYGKNLLNSQDHFGTSATHVAVMYGQQNILKLLLSQPGININLQAYRDSNTGNTHSPFDMAIKYNQPVEQNARLTRL